MSFTKRYFLTLVVFVSTGCAPLQPSGSPHPFELPQAIAAQSLPRIAPLTPSYDDAPGQEVVMHALTLLESKYKFGGKSLESGLDCSGLVSHVYDTALGMPVEGSAANIAEQGRRINRKELQAGDLVFFNTMNRPRSHVGIYVGNGKFVHAENSRTGVRINRMTDSYYAARFEEARTLLR